MNIRFKALLSVSFLGLAMNLAWAQEKKVDLKPKDTRSEAQKNFDRNLENANKVSARQQQEATKEAMRDKSHDNRAKVGKDTSVGADPQKGTVNVRKTTP